MLQEQEEKQEQAAKPKQETPKKAEPVYIIDDDDDDDDGEEQRHLHADEIDAIAEEEEEQEQEDEEEESTPPHDLQSPPSYADTDSDCFDRQRSGGGRYTSDSESDFRPYKPSRSGRSTPEYAGGHRKSVSFDLSGDERSKSDYERSRSRTPDRFGRAYDSEQDTRAASRMPRKGILRATSPSSSTSSTLERQPQRAAAPPIVPAVVRIREVESPSRVQHVSRATSPDPHPDELQRENPFRRQEDDDEYTKIAKAINRSPRSPRDQFFFSSSTRSSEDLLETQSHSSGRSTPSTVISKSTENLTTGARAKQPPPPTLPKPQLKKADLVRNVALETFQASDVGHGDFAVFEHDASTNTIHEVVPQLPKLPVRVVRPRESPPPPPVNFASPPPVNYATLPKLPRSPKSPLPVEAESLYMEALPATPPSQRRPHDFVHENSPDNILVTPEQHRDFLLRENEMRNQLRAPHEPAPPIPIAGGLSYGVNNPFLLDTSDTDIDNLPLPPPPPTRTPSPPTPPTPTLSTLTLPAYSRQLTNSTNASTSYASSNMPLEQQQQQPLILGSATPAQIFPMAQILPVQYASLPQPQQPNKLTLGGGGAGAAAGATSSSTFNLLLLPDAAQSTAAGLLYLQATPAQLSVSEATTTTTSSSKSSTSPVTPSYAAMKFPTFSEIVVTSSVADSNSNYQNMSTSSRVVGISNTSLGGNSTSSSFSINSSNSSLQQTTMQGGSRRLPAASAVSSYYETAEEIYSTIEEEAIYSNTAFFDSRRSSDTSLNLCPPPPLPPKRPLKPSPLPPSKLRTAPAPPVAQKPQGLRGGGGVNLANFKLRSQSQPQLVGAGAAAGGVTPSTPTTPTGKETTV